MPQEFARLDEILLSEGFQYLEKYRDINSVYEVLYIRNPEYYEIHKSLFDPDDQVFRKFNRYFDNERSQTMSFTVHGTELLTIDYTRHMLFLILHVFKHFLFSGFGIRQICDITLLANKYGPEIDWDFVIEACRDLQAYEFMCAVFKISEKHLILDRNISKIPAELLDNDIDEQILLEDILKAGIMGGGDINRLHSSNITLHAVRNKEAEKGEKQTNPGQKNIKCRIRRARRLLATLFPSYKLIINRYTYLQKYPFLLPAAWIQRIARYMKDMRQYKRDNPFKALQIGEERTQILRKYHII